jgi:hypothetical protein
MKAEEGMGGGHHKRSERIEHQHLKKGTEQKVMGKNNLPCFGPLRTVLPEREKERERVREESNQ